MTSLNKTFIQKSEKIDIIAKEDQTLVFVEVKYRKDDKKGYPAQAVDQRKQQKIRKSAMIYLKKNHLSFEQPIRFDCSGDFRKEDQGDKTCILKNQTIISLRYYMRGLFHI